MEASQAKSIELKRQLITMHKTNSRSMDQYHREAKQIADSLAAISYSISSQDFIDHVILGLGKEYDILVRIITYFPGSLSLEEPTTKLLLHEQRLRTIQGYKFCCPTSSTRYSKCELKFIKYLW